jgi:transcriptional regulator with XRE-family HTH domain
VSEVPRAAVLRGRVLYAWRTYVGMTGEELALVLGSSEGHVSGLESGTLGHKVSFRHPMEPPTSPDDPERFDRLVSAENLAAGLALSADETLCFVAMWRAAGSPAGVMPQRSTHFNFRLPGRPGWVWVRGQAGAPVNVRMNWGQPFTGVIAADKPGAELFIQLPTTVPNPPLEVVLSEPGWVDAGHGVIPEKVATALGATVVPASRIARSQKRDTPEVAPWHTRVMRRTPSPSSGKPSNLLQRLHQTLRAINLEWHLVAEHIGILESDRPAYPAQARDLETSIRPGPRLEDEDGKTVAQMLMTGRDLRRLRDARGLTRDALAEQVTRLDPHAAVNRKTIETLEGGERIPPTRALLGRVDTVLAGRGLVAFERCFDSRGRRTSKGMLEVVFPEYWIGPVWLQFIDPVDQGEGDVKLVWGRWTLRRRCISGQTLTTRRSPATTSHLLVQAPPGWRVHAGTGQPPHALDVNVGWWPTTVRAGLAELHDNVSMITAHLR